MRTKMIVLAVTLLSVCAALSAQDKNAVDKRVQLARSLYPQRLEKIASVRQYERDEIPNVNYTTVVRKQNWAGAGQSADKTEYFYAEKEAEGEPNPVGYVLLIVRRTYNMGSRDVFEEFVYDDDGNPLFWFSKSGYDGEKKVELRGYFSANGLLIRSLTKGTDDKELVQHDFDAAKKNILSYKKAFQTLYGVVY